MKKTVVISVFVSLLVAVNVHADQGWQDNQDGQGFICANVGYFQANNLAGSGNRCARVDPTGKLIPASFDCLDPSALSYQFWSDGTFSPLPQEPLSTAGVGLSIADDPGDGATVISLPVLMTPGSCTNCSLSYDFAGRITTASSGTAPVTSIGVTAPITTTGGATPTIGYNAIAANRLVANATGSSAVPTSISMGSTSGVMEYVNGSPDTLTTFASSSARVPFGSGTSGQLTDSSILQFSTALDQLQVAFTKATGQNGLKITNSSSNNTAFTDLALVNDLGDSFRSDIYYTDSNYIGTEAGPSSLAFGTAGGSGSGIYFSPNNVKAAAFLPTGVLVPSLAAGGMVKATVTTGKLAIASAGTDYQTPITACTDYVSLSCVSGATDLGGTNATPTVIGIENDAAMRGDILATTGAAPAMPSAGHSRFWEDSTAKTLMSINEFGVKSHTVQSRTAGGSLFVNGISDSGVTTAAQPAFSDLTGTLTCAQLPAFSGGDLTSAGGTCALSLVNTIAAGTYRNIISETVDANGRATAFSASSTPVNSTLSWQMNQGSLAIGYENSTIVLPSGGGVPVTLTAAAGVPVATTLAANYGSSTSSPPTYPFRVAWESVSCAVDVGASSTAGSGSATLQFDLWGVVSNPATPANWTQLGNTTGLSISGGATSFQALGFTVNSIAVNTSLTLLARRTDLNNLMTITNLAFQAVCSMAQ